MKGGGVLWYFHTYIGSGHFFGFKILNLTIIIIFFLLGGGGGSEKIFFWGDEDFVDIFGGSTQNWTIFRGHFYVFKGIFLRSSYRMGDTFWAAKILNIFRALEIPDLFCWNVDAGHEPTYEKKIE